MAESTKGPWKGKGHNLEAAAWHAWEKAKEDDAPPGEYKIEISIKASNPIHAYIVTITPPGG